ncbi:MAG: hypothetical protein COB37_08990 [Kordiimonadales bacterium]|nr:MAG: hypothetical protein COB37_08990 [Kordiimonadales bacterium]
MTSILTPILALIVWTLIVWLWMYLTRIPAMKAAKIEPQAAAHPGSLNVLPSNIRAIADNYNHLHEQPTIFYALAVYSHLAGTASGWMIDLAWGYVALRILHSVAQNILQNVTVRFSLFFLTALVLIAMAAMNVVALL